MVHVQQGLAWIANSLLPVCAIWTVSMLTALNLAWQPG